MPPSTRIPSHLQPYVHLPCNESLVLLTSTLGASANWIITRFLCDALSNNPEDGGDEQGLNVVLVSWMREYDFWKQEARKGAGLDLERLRRGGRFVFVDGLSEVCLDTSSNVQVGRHSSNGTEQKQQEIVTSATEGSPTQRGPQTLPLRGPPGRMLPARGPLQIVAQQAASATTTTSIPMQSSNIDPTIPGHYTLKSLDLVHLKTTLTRVVSTLTSSTSTTTVTAPRKTLLVLDNPDLLLALSPTTNQSAMTSLILTLHNLPNVSHVLTHIQADNPLLSLSQPPQPLEIEHHNFLVSMGHMSQRILGVRVLDTGVARDVSGVIRITEQRTGWMDLGFDDDGEKGKDSDESRKGREFLYQVRGDGSVRVFERGAGGEG